MRNYKIKNLKSPIQLPHDSTTSKLWQKFNRGWWELHPMLYQEQKKILGQPNSPHAFREIDSIFFKSVRHYMPWSRIPFDNLIDFGSLTSKDVLEIGVGCGSTAELIASHCKSFTGIDLTDTACQMTRRRFQFLNLSANLLQMDAENMSFRDSSFDYIWSWGVVHHSANTRQIINEMHRVLRPGGEAVVMVYHRSFLKYYVETGFVRGFLQGGLLRYRSLNGVLQACTDGAIARHYLSGEWSELCRGLFEIKKFLVFGQKTELFLLPQGRLKNILMNIIPDALTQFFTNQLRFGSFLVAMMRKI